MTKSIVFVLGGPGSGKGTQCERIVAEYGYKHLSAGDLLRAEVASGSETGEMCSQLMKEGKLVPMEVTIGLLEKAMSDGGGSKFLIDGFPRALDQAEAFETKICAPSAVLFFDCPEEEMEKRLLKRGETSGRADDNAETIKKRFTTFVEQSVPVVDSYERRGLAYKISAVPPPDQVYVNVKAALDQVEGTNPKNEVVFVLGGPGSGKGTQCEQIVADFGFKHISAGDLLRNEVASGSDTGKMCADLMKEGKLVPVEVTIGLLKAEMDRSDNHLFLIDGFPRATDQAKAFEDELGPPSAVLFFDCPEEEMEKRLLKRGETSGRADDNAETIKKRFTTFVEQSVPVVEEYEARGLAYKISAVPPPSDVYKNVKNALLKVTGPLGDATIVFLFGGPGAGKGTQSAKIVKEFKYTHLSTGDIMRSEVAAGTELGRQVATMVAEGKLVPDEMTVKLIKKEIVESGAKHFVLDGFPRTLAQAKMFEKAIKKPTAAILLECPWDELEARVLKRGETSGRTDDNLETVRKRFDVFREHTLPVVDHYYDIGLGYKLSTTSSLSETFSEVKKIFGALRRPMASSNSMGNLVEHHNPHAAGALSKLIDPWTDLDVIFLLGGPGSGKGTQSQKITEKYGYYVLAAGDLLRDEVARGSVMGRQCAGLMSAGKLVPMETTLVIIKKAMLERAQEEGAKRFLVTGFPRSIQQAEAFELEVKKPMVVICLDVAEKVMQMRLMKSNTFKGAAHMTRQTHAETFQQRFQTYKDNTIPVIELFEHQGLAKRVSAEGSADDVFEEICKHLDNVHHQESLPSHRTPLLCISGPPGAGKHTLIGKLKKEFKKMVGFSVSHTTKEMRLGDVDGEQYYYTDKATMEAEIAEGKFLEHAVVRGDMYGTSFAAVQDVLDEGKVCILDINVQGVQEVKNNPSAVKAMFVFVKPPSIQALEDRLKKRGADSEDSVAKKVASAQLEISTATSSDLFDLVITNEDVDEAYNELREYLHSKMPATFTNPQLVAKRNARIAEEEMLKAIPASLDPDLPVREYMKKHVISVLKRGMNALNETRPGDPLQFLADYLVSHKPSTA